MHLSFTFSLQSELPSYKYITISLTLTTKKTDKYILSDVFFSKFLLCPPLMFTFSLFSKR